MPVRQTRKARSDGGVVTVAPGTKVGRVAEALPTGLRAEVARPEG
jgi:hypothetical protein